MRRVFSVLMARCAGLAQSPQPAKPRQLIGALIGRIQRDDFKPPFFHRKCALFKSTPRFGGNLITLEAAGRAEVCCNSYVAPLSL